MNTKLRPFIYQIEDNPTSLKDFEQQMKFRESEEVQDIILNYPTVYIHNCTDSSEYEVYIGESNNIIQRTKHHYDAKATEGTWQNEMFQNNAKLIIIGHEHFNKSLTLDIEDRLMLYISSVSKVRRIHNKRGNPQNKYYTSNEFEDIFNNIWTGLRRKNPDLFPKESEIKDSALFKASPLHRLTKEQVKAKEEIIKKVKDAFRTGKTGQVIFCEGEAGTGKTVLNSSLFYELCTSYTENIIEDMQCYLLVNHDQQITVYEQIARKLGLTDKNADVVSKPTKFINNHSKDEPVDVVFVDEAHLLWTQGKQAYRGKNQLEDIIQRSRVTVVMFDENQILRTEQYWEHQAIEKLRDNAINTENYIKLTNQLRMNADEETIEWIHKFTKELCISKIPSDKKGYEIKIFEDPNVLEQEIRSKAENESSALSRIIATFDWEYIDKKTTTNRLSKYWEVCTENWHMPWNLQIPADPKDKKKNKTLSWAEQAQTINEVGSTFTIQGFDLNYAGVILGPSVKYRNGKIIFDPSCSKNRNATKNRTLVDGTKRQFGEKLLQNEVRVLLTRGVNGVYIYACDEALRKALIKASI